MCQLKESTPEGSLSPTQDPAPSTEAPASSPSAMSSSFFLTEVRDFFATKGQFQGFLSAPPSTRTLSQLRPGVAGGEWWEGQVGLRTVRDEQQEPADEDGADRDEQGGQVGLLVELREQPRPGLAGRLHRRRTLRHSARGSAPTRVLIMAWC